MHPVSGRSCFVSFLTEKELPFRKGSSFFRILSDITIVGTSYLPRFDIHITVLTIIRNIADIVILASSSS